MDNGVTALYAVLDQTFGRTLNYNTKPNATKHGKKDLRHMANIWPEVHHRSSGEVYSRAESSAKSISGIRCGRRPHDHLRF